MSPCRLLLVARPDQPGVTPGSVDGGSNGVRAAVIRETVPPWETAGWKIPGETVIPPTTWPVFAMWPGLFGRLLPPGMSPGRMHWPFSFGSTVRVPACQSQVAHPPLPLSAYPSTVPEALTDVAHPWVMPAGRPRSVIDPPWSRNGWYRPDAVCAHPTAWPVA